MSGAENSLNIHASCIQLGACGAAFGAPESAGVLILGKSGAGKSTTVLQCLGRGAHLVSDDRCDVCWRDGGLWAAPPATLAGLIEVRGAGILRLPYVPEARIVLVVSLEAGARLPEPEVFIPRGLPAPAGDYAAPPLVRLLPDGGIVDKIALIAAAFAQDLFCHDARTDPPPS